MVNLSLIVIAALSLGFLTKLVDLEVDNDIDLRGMGCLLALFYGLIMVYTIRNVVILSSLILAVIIAVIATGKIDSFSHGIGVGTALAGTLILGIPPVNWPLFMFFLITALLDEIASDLADSGKLTGFLGKFFKMRPFLELTTLLFSLYTYYFEFWVFIFIYDVSYQLTRLFVLHGRKLRDWDVENRSG